MSVSQFIGSFSEEQDIGIFSVADDLYSSDSSVKEFNHKKLFRHIEQSAYRAKQVLNAQARLMLARYQAETLEQELDYQNQAEAIAYELGAAEYNGLETPTNPFDDPALSAAWNNGYSYSAHQGKPQNQLRLEQKLWEQGIDLESETSQFELAAITLYNLSSKTADPQVAERCKRLAFEMATYGSDYLPSPKRQYQLNTFMAKQTERLAQSLDSLEQ